MKIKAKLEKWSWYAFDMGNSAHALMISTVGFALYFQQYLFASSSDASWLWAVVTSIVLLLAALASPVVGFYSLYGSNRRFVLWCSTIGSVSATILLGFSENTIPQIAVLIYVLSAFGYYMALPVYNSYLPDIATGKIQSSSARGWALGYLGGIGIVGVTLALGLLDHPVAEKPENYRLLFIVAGIYNLVLSSPFLFLSKNISRNESISPKDKEIFRLIIKILQNRSISRLLLAYWLLAEVATVVVYFTAIFLAEFANLAAKDIFILTLVIQALAFVTTWVAGEIAQRLGPKRVFLSLCIIWCIIPSLLWLVTIDFSYWYALIGLSLVLGSFHAIVRGHIGKLSRDFVERAEEGTLWGLLEVAGRISQFLGPILVAIVTFFASLPVALLVATVFPILALWIAWGYKWELEQH